ncbi:MAG TPA: 3-oxoacyl-[acyl-carrier-protein] synthase III C-terminal domain-containing protein [Polyangiaceae bacterium]
MTSSQQPDACPPYAAIIATATCFPDDIVTNQRLITQYGHRVTDAAVSKIYGIEQRRFAAPGTTDSDLLAEAARRCLERAALGVERLSKLIVTKFLGDRLLPMTASFVQRKLDCSVAVQAFDIDGGTHCFLQALDLANVAVASGDEYVLIVSGGICAQFTNQRDPLSAFSYGDGAAAVLVGRSSTPGFEASYQVTDARFAEHSVGFEMRRCIPKDAAELADTERFYRLYRTHDEKATWEVQLDIGAEIMGRLLESAKLSPADIDLFLITENHRRLWTKMVTRLGIAESKTLSMLREYGNTMSAMLPALLHEAIERRRIAPGGRVMLLSFGEGISAGGLIVRLPKPMDNAGDVS